MSAEKDLTRCFSASILSSSIRISLDREKKDRVDTSSSKCKHGEISTEKDN